MVVVVVVVVVFVRSGSSGGDEWDRCVSLFRRNRPLGDLLLEMRVNSNSKYLVPEAGVEF